MQSSNGKGVGEYEGFGSIRQDPPPLLLRTLNLLNTMLSSALPGHTRVALCRDVEKILELHITTIEPLFTSYPRCNELVMQVLSCMFLSLPPYDESHLGRSLHRKNKPSILRERLGRHVLELSLHLAQYPFPISYLGPLPNHIWNMRMKKIGNSSNEQCWWDFVSPVRDDLHIEITGPHFGLNESNFRSQEKLQKWSEEMYSYAVASSEDACLGLTYLVKYILKCLILH